MAQQQPRQIHANEQCAGVVRRCSSQIHATEEDARRSGCSPASPLEIEDLLREILVRLPPHPSSLPCASAVCKRWQHLVTDPKFLHRFRVHHKKPPLLGFFHQPKNDIVFTPALGPSERIPPHRFDLRQSDVQSGTKVIVDLLDCRHGRVLFLLKERARRDVIVCDPFTGEQHGLPSPPKFENYTVNGAVLCATSERDHVHGSCRSSPFKVVLISYLRGVNGPIACVYSSNTGMWGDIISVDVPTELVFTDISGLLVGNTLYWLLVPICNGILEFDLDEHSLAMINGPTITNDFCHHSHWIIQLEDGAVGIAILSYPRFQLWQMNVGCHGVVTWMMWKTIDMHNIPGLPQLEGNKAAVNSRILGCVQDTNEILLSVDRNIYMVQLKSMQSRKLCKQHWYSNYHCFQSFYPPGPAISDGYNGAEMLHDA